MGEAAATATAETGWEGAAGTGWEAAAAPDWAEAAATAWLQAQDKRVSVTLGGEEALRDAVEQARCALCRDHGVRARA